jgi:(p)ppGpp synthase/HD superfamily hydrolase
VLTPHAAIVELPQGATPVDFAYTVHTSLGHRCRGARVDGAMVPLNTPLQNGQTVEIIAAKEGGPSRDWLNAELGFLASHRARAKVRAWFNEQITHETVARGREAVEKLLQREGKHGRSSWRTWRRSWASSRPTTCSRWSARTSSRCATSRRCCVRRSRAGPDDEGVL